MPVNNDLISRSALLEKRFKMHSNFLGSVSVVTVKDIEEATAVDAEKVFEQMGLVKEAFEMAKSSLAPAGPQWISVKDRLPEAGKPVLAYGHFDATMTAYWDGARWHTNWDSSLLTDGFITHWMCLPEPPEEG